MLAQATLDVIVVATPNDTHVPMAEQCLRAGKHVVVDKPVAVSSTEAASLLAVSRQTGRRVFVFHNRRWDGDFAPSSNCSSQTSSALCAPSSRTSTASVPRPNRAPGAKPPAMATASCSTLAPTSATRRLSSSACLRRSGVMCVRSAPAQPSMTPSTCACTIPKSRYGCAPRRISALPAVRFLAEGTQGSYRKDNLDPQEDALRAGDLFKSKPWGVDPESAWGAITTLDANGATRHTAVPTLAGDYRGFYANVRDTLLGKAEQAVTLVDAWRVLRLLEWARESSESHAAIVCDWSDTPQL